VCGGVLGVGGGGVGGGWGGGGVLGLFVVERGVGLLGGWGGCGVCARLVGIPKTQLFHFMEVRWAQSAAPSSTSSWGGLVRARSASLVGEVD